MIKCPNCGSTAQFKLSSPPYFNKGIWKQQKQCGCGCLIILHFEEKIDKMNSKFEKLMGAIETLITQNKEMERREQEAKAELKAEMEKRMPTPKQRLSMRSTKSSPLKDAIFGIVINLLMVSPI